MSEDFFGVIGSRERRRRLQKNSQLQINYGITLKAYEDMHNAQEGVCAICKQPERGVHRRGVVSIPLSLAVDHDHVTGAVRALLCTKCNKALGLLNDDPNLLKTATRYLQQHRSLED